MSVEQQNSMLNGFYVKESDRAYQQTQRQNITISVPLKIYLFTYLICFLGPFQLMNWNSSIFCMIEGRYMRYAGLTPLCFYFHTFIIQMLQSMFPQACFSLPLALRLKSLINQLEERHLQCTWSYKGPCHCVLFIEPEDDMFCSTTLHCKY